MNTSNWIHSSLKLSVIIPARNEFPNIVHTFYSIVHCLEAEGFTPQDFEIIIVDNCSNDNKFEHRGTAGTTSYLEGRGAYHNNTIKIVRDPLAGNHSARNKGVSIARGEYIFISDAHMAYKPGFFKEMIRAVDESGGLAHGTLQHMGAYPPVDSSSGYSYTIALGQEVKGTWNNYFLADDWWYIPAQGHWGLMAKRKQFIDFGGYPKVHRTYGGGEFYLDTLWWMLGSCVVTNPRAIGYHLSAGRNYIYNQHRDYKNNVLNVAYALGMDDWRERSYLNFMRSVGKNDLDLMMTRGEVEMKEEREFVMKHGRCTYNDLLVNRPWDAMNDKRHGKHNGAMKIFHWSWLDEVKENPLIRQCYLQSKYQQELGEFIEKNLEKYIYRVDEWKARYTPEQLLNLRSNLTFNS